MENLNVVNDTPQAVVEPAAHTAQNGDNGGGTPPTCVHPESTARKQSAEQNAGFRKMRLENEGYRKEIEQLKSQLTKASEMEQYKKSSDIYLDKLIESRMQADLREIQKLRPEISDLESLGEDFLKLVENGVDAKIAFSAVCAASEGAQTPTPPQTGPVGVREDANGEFFSSKELDRLTAKDLDNPTIFKKALKSLKRL